MSSAGLLAVTAWSSGVCGGINRPDEGVVGALRKGARLPVKQVSDR